MKTLQIKREIFRLLNRYNSEAISKIRRDGIFWDDLKGEIEYSALLINSGANLIAEVNRIRRMFFRTEKSLPPGAPLDRGDYLDIETIGVLYQIGGAEAVYKYMPPKSERHSREVAKLLSKCFGWVTPEGEKKNPNQARYREERKSFNNLVAMGYQVRPTAYGSVYLVKGKSKIRFSTHDTDAWWYADVNNNFLIAI